MPIQTLLNSRKSAVLAAEQALQAASSALTDYPELNSALQQAEQALRAAGWQHALRFNQALLTAMLFIADDEVKHASFEAALSVFQATLRRRNLQELACSTVLIKHYRILCASTSTETERPSIISLDEFALAERLIPQALLATELSANDIARIRERYERALLTVLRTSTQEASSLTEAALDELSACLAELAHPSPYNMWYLACMCLRAQRQAGYAYDEDAKRLYARYNLLLNTQIETRESVAWAPLAVVRNSVALLWRAFAIEGAPANSGEYVQLLRDYGLSVSWRLLDFNEEQASAYAKGAQLLSDAGSSEDKQIGALTLSRHAYEDFLIMARLSITTLANYTNVAITSDKPQAGLSLQASEAAYRLASLACQIGLAKLAWFAEMLGLAWRRYAYMAAQFIETPSPAILQEGSEILEERLQQLKEGNLPEEVASDYCVSLAAFIESATKC